MPTPNIPLSPGKWFSSDQQFHHLYPQSVQVLATRHWTPLYIARKAARFLAADDNSRVLDIGSGIGKFCLAAAHFEPGCRYTGVEQRRDLVAHANLAKEILGESKVNFIHGNFTYLDLRNYDHFYFYNSFYENLDGSDKIDRTIHHSGSLYNYYNGRLFQYLQQAPAGTKLVSYCSLDNEVPPSFQLVESDKANQLKFWRKP